MKILNRAKHLYSDEYFTSESVIIEYGNMFLLIGDVRVECDISTRSIHLSDMLDSEGTKIFASLSEDGKGGSIIEFALHIGVVRYKKGTIVSGVLDLITVLSVSKECKVIGIQE